jgi:hypothetical protein
VPAGDPNSVRGRGQKKARFFAQPQVPQPSAARVYLAGRSDKAQIFTSARESSGESRLRPPTLGVGQFRRTKTSVIATCWNRPSLWQSAGRWASKYYRLDRGDSHGRPNQALSKGKRSTEKRPKNVTALWSRDVAKKFEERKAILEQDKKHRQRLTSKLEKAIRSLAKNRNILAHFTILGSIPKEAEDAVTLRLARSMYDARHKAHLEHDIK